MLMPMLKTEVNRTVVKTMAITATIFLVLFCFKERLESSVRHFLLLTLNMALTCNSTVLDADNAVCHLRYFFIVGNHHDSLLKLLAGDF